MHVTLILKSYILKGNIKTQHLQDVERYFKDSQTVLQGLVWFMLLQEANTDLTSLLFLNSSLQNL